MSDPSSGKGCTSKPHARGAAPLYTGRTEEKFIPELQAAVDRGQQLRDAFVEATLSESGVQPQMQGVIAALVDFWTWRPLRRGAGLSQDETIRSVAVAVQQIAGAEPGGGSYAARPAQYVPGK